MHGYIENKTYYKIESESQRLKLGGGCWTINLSEISGKEVENIEYITPKHTYSISLTNAMKKGFIRHLGGELKLIIPINKWEIKER